MKIKISEFSKAWKGQFNVIKLELKALFPNKKIVIEHIGSTAVNNLSAKPIIDIMIGVKTDKELDSIINPLIENGYIYYEKYNSIMPNRRFFIKLKSKEQKKIFKSIYTSNDELPHELINDLRLAQIHVWKYNSDDWIRHIAVRDYLINNEAMRLEYQKIKIDLGKLNWNDGIEYNKKKNSFMIQLEEEALNYYKNI